ncbi:MAG: hypothetical protein HDR04_08005 [Lachnospiraceae bacterium]|nr:hypothetical protein [Lachnospiraceae bacterium]
MLREYAEEFMKKKAEADYVNVYAYYLERMDSAVVSRDGVRFVFELPDHSAYGVTYRWNDELHTYAEVDLADYQERDGKTRTLHSGGEEIEMMQVFQKLSEE